MSPYELSVPFGESLLCLERIQLLGEETWSNQALLTQGLDPKLLTLLGKLNRLLPASYYLSMHWRTFSPLLFITSSPNQILKSPFVCPPYKLSLFIFFVLFFVLFLSLFILFLLFFLSSSPYLLLFCSLYSFIFGLLVFCSSSVSPFRNPAPSPLFPHSPLPVPPPLCPTPSPWSHFAKRGNITQKHKQSQRHMWFWKTHSLFPWRNVNKV